MVRSARVAIRAVVFDASGPSLLMAMTEKAGDEGREPVTTEAGLPVERSYGPETLTGDFADRLGSPGEFPFTRGNHPGGYRDRLWTFRQYSGFGTPEWSNERYRLLLKEGGTGLSVAADLPTQIGYDSDDPEVEEEVGRVGVALDSLADAEILFRDIPLDQISTSWTVNGTAAIMLAFYVAVGDRQGVPRQKLRGTMQNDILKEYVARGTWIWPPTPSIRLVADSIEFCASEVPRYNAVSVAGAHFRDAGANAAQEMAFTLQDAVTYCDEIVQPGPADHRRVRSPDLLLLLHPQRLLRGGREVPQRPQALGADRTGALRRQRAQLVYVPDRRGLWRMDTASATAAEQHRACGLPGDGGRARRRAVDVHGGVGRAVRTPDRGEHDARTAHAADPGLRDGRDQNRRSARRLVLRRVTDRRDGGAS